MSFCLQFLFQYLIIFNNAIMHQGKFISIAGMGVGIDFVRLAMCRPSGMAYSHNSIEFMPVQGFFKYADFTDFFKYFDFPVLKYS